MITLSICMIVKNEEDVIGRALECVKDIADEIIVVDTGSTDRTMEIVSRYTNKVYYFEWISDFAAARNYSFSKATMDYQMWLDADDVIDEKNRELLKQLKQELDPAVDMVRMKYDVGFDQNGNTTFSYYRERIFKRAMNYKWVGEIHEVIVPYGNTISNEIAIMHKKIRQNEPQRNLKIFEKMIREGKPLDPRAKYYYARELYYNGRISDAVAAFNAFLDEGKGWVENNIDACKDLARCHYMLGQPETALMVLFKSFTYDAPRAELCCDIGNHFLDKGEINTAIFWYQLAASKKIDGESGSFLQLDAYGYTPYIQLCLCYDRLGQYAKAAEYNELAGKLKPNDKSYLYNKEYFSKMNLQG